MKLSRRLQVLPCRAFCVADGAQFGDCTWMAEADGDHEPVHAAAAGHVRQTGHPVKVVMTRTVLLSAATEGAS